MSRGGQMLKERLSDRTYTYRRNLLWLSMLAIVIAATDWTPRQLPWLGPLDPQEDLPNILWILLAAIAYFILGFLVSAWPDHMASLARIASSWGVRGEEGPRWQTAAGPYAARHLFDFWFPLLVAGLALVGLTWKAIFGNESGFAWIALLVMRILSIAFLGIGVLFFFIAGAENLFLISAARRWLHKPPPGAEEPEDEEENRWGVAKNERSPDG